MTLLTHTSTFDAAAGLRRHTITVPETAPDPYVSVIALTVEGDASMEQAHLQQNDGSVVLDAYTATIHDKEFMPDKPRRAVDFKMFTVPLRGEGIMPGRMLSVGGFDQGGPGPELGFPDWSSREPTRSPWSPLGSEPELAACARPLPASLWRMCFTNVRE